MTSILYKYAQYLSNAVYRQGISNVIKCLEQSKTNSTVLLDLGCGEGTLTSKFANVIGTKEVYALDISEGIDVEKITSKGIKLIRADLNESFPLKSEVVDIVITQQCVEHLIETDNFFEEIYRVLKIGGYAVIRTDNLAQWDSVFFLVFGCQPSCGPSVSKKHLLSVTPLQSQSAYTETTKYAPPHYNVMTFKALKRLLNRNKFVIEKCFGDGYYPLPPFISRVFCRLDIWHSKMITIKVRKP